MTSSPETRLWTPPDLGTAPGAPRDAEREPAPPGTERAWTLPEIDSGAAAGIPAAPRTEWDEGFDRGRAEGLREGAARAERRVHTALEAVYQAATFIEAARGEFERTRERNLECVALAVAQKLIQRDLKADPTILRDLVGRAIELLPLDSTLEVRLHPADLEALGVELERVAPPGRTPSVQWTADPVLERGSFMVESPLRIVDGRTDVALRTLYARLDHE